MNGSTPNLHSRLLLAALIAAFVFAPAAQAQKLYRWTDKDGNVHYSDSVPPEAVENARDELNKQGITVKSVERAMTEEERAAKEAEEAALAKAEEEAAEKAKQDQMLLTSYPNEKNLKDAYAERERLLEQSIESAQAGVTSQQKSLTDLLAHAASLEQAGKPVPKKINDSIELARTQLAQQNRMLETYQSEHDSLDGEREAALTHYREVKTEYEADQKRRKDGQGR